MTNKHSTKCALLTSILAMLLCITTLLGTTFAWFTDSVTSAGNIIQSGNLKVGLDYWDGDSWETVQGADEIFDSKALWEPGYTKVVYLKLSNLGSLALKYQLAINVLSETEGINEEGDTFKLSDYIQMGVVENVNGEDKDAAYANGDDAVNAVKDSSGIIGNGYTKNGTMLADAAELYMAVVVYMPKTVDNVANHNGINIPEINLGINVIATQTTVESDSFDEYYDGGAAWFGDFDYSWYDAEATELTVGSAEQLAALAAIVNGTASVSTYAAGSTDAKVVDNFAGQTITLASDIDLNNIPWTPIGQTGATQFAGAFDGNGKTIYNLNIDNTANTNQYGAAGLFGWVEQHSGSNSIKNLTIDGVKIASHRYSGAIAGWINIPVTNCTVKNVTINCSYYNDDTDGTKVGALVGYADNKSALTKNTVDTAVLTAYGDVGGLAGVAQTTVSVDGNAVKNVRIIYSSDKKSEPGEIVSTRVNPVMGTNTAENVTFVKSVVVENAEDLATILTSDKKNIVATLTCDIDLPMSSLGNQTSGSGEYKLGGEATETIVVDLNGHKLNLTTTYMSAIGAKNADATITIKNGTMNSTGNSSTTWNINDLIFANCNYQFENVTFNKEVALTNTGKSVEMENVTINGTGDYYALWIQAEGQNVIIDGLTINSNGRGIKIDEQYANDNVAKVALSVSNATFNTKKKAAIMVKSAKGADIVLNNIDFVNTIDTIHAVWVDEDAVEYANLVTVTGGEKANEAEVVVDLADLQSKLNNASGKAYLELVNDLTGNVTVTQKPGVEITLEGNGKTFAGVITVDGKSATYTTAGLTIMNMNFKADSISADACIRLGDGTNATRYTCNVTVKNCTFDVPGAVGVKSYTGGDKNLTITDCVATENAHSLVQAKGIDGILAENCKVYSKNGLNFNNSDNVTIKGCTVDVKGYAVRFGESSGGAGAAETYKIENCTLKSANDDGDAIVILRGTADNSTLTMNNTTLTGNIQIKDNASKATIIIDGKIYVSTADELAAAVADGKTDIYLLPGEYDMLDSGLQGKTLTIKGTKDTVIDATAISENNQFVTGATLEFDGVTINFGKTNYMGFANTASLSYKNCTINGLQFLYGDNVTFENCVFNSNGAEHSVWTYGAQKVSFTRCSFTYADRAINVYGVGRSSVTLSFDGCTFITENASSKGAVEINSSAFPQGANVSFVGCTAPAHGTMVGISGWDESAGATATVTVGGAASTPAQWAK